MVNERQGKEYKVTPIYNRRLARQVIRNRIEKTQGYGNVSSKMSDAFKKYQTTWNKREVE